MAIVAPPPATCYQRRAVGDRQELEARSVELHELPTTPSLRRPLGNREHEVGRGRTLGETLDEPEPDDFGINIEIGWPSIAASASIPPTPIPTPTVDHRRVRIGADERVRIGQHPAVNLLAENDAREYSRLTWWTMPVSGGTTRKLSKASCPQRRNV
jgi:hypothetical protein